MKTTTTMIRVLLFTLLLPITLVAQSTSSGLVQCSEEAISEAEGTLANSSSSRPKVKWEGGQDAPKTGARGELQKYFETELFGGTVRGWLVIGVVKALATTQGSTEFSVLEAKSSMTVNGEAKSHFVAGKKVKFLEYEYASEELQTITELGYRSEGRLACGQKRGEWKKYAPSGKLVELSTYDEEGKLDGPWKAFYASSGAKETVGTYKDGDKTSIWETYYEDGQIKTSRDHERFGQEHPYRAWHPNGKLQEEGNYNNKGQKSGDWKTYRDDGTLMQVRMYDVKGIPGAVTGYKSFGEKGELREEGYWNALNQMSGKHISYYPDGKVERSQHYEDGRLNGPYQYFHANGQLASEGYYVNGTKQGLWNSYYENGKQMFKISLMGETANGTWRCWHPNGNLAETGSFSMGKKVGVWVTFAENGVRQNLSNYQNGHLNGPFQVWHPDGTLAEFGSYNEGKLHGNYTSYFPDGKVKEVGLYENGQRVGKWTTRDENGKKKMVKY